MAFKKTLSFFFVAVCISFYAQAQIVSTFDTDDEGWTVGDYSDGNSTAIIYHPTGGNPGGYLSSAPISISTAFYWKAPAKFKGGHCLDSYGMNLKFDLQLSAAGNITTASTQHGNVRISCSAGYSIVAIITPPEPAVTPGWTSYTVKLDETTAWHTGILTGALSTRQEILVALSSITKLEIVAQNAFGSDPDVAIDNVILEKATLGTPPSITSFTPKTGIPLLTNVTITGSNFNVTAANNIVYFGGVKAVVTSATATQLVVKVPAGASFAPIIVYNKITGLSASSSIPFQPLYDNNKDNGGQIIRATMAPAVKFDLDNSSGTSAVGDIDGDGLNDIVAGDGGGGSPGGKFNVFRNAGVTGNISTASFFPKVSFPTTNQYAKAFVALDDFDGDGKLDVAISTASTFVAFVTVFRNTSTPGNISFGPEQNYAGLSYSDGPITTADMDRDGRPEIICVFNNNCATGDRLYIYPNRSTPGNIDFCGFSTFGPVLTCGGHVTVGDLDGDKLPDVVVDASTVTVFRNTSTLGSLTLAAPFVLTTNATGRPVIADLDSDGKSDIAWGFSTFNVEVRKNNYSGGTFDASSFSPQILLNSTVYAASEVVASDINGDGKVDLVLTSSNDMGILQNVATTGSLTSASFLTGVPFAANEGTNYNINPVVADFDGDNKSDILIRTTNTTPRKMLLYRNESYPAPRIDNLSAASGNVSSNITMTGDHFLTGTLPAVTARVGEIPVSIVPSSNTSAALTVSSGLISGRLSITEHGLTAFSKPFNVLFQTSRTIDATSFATKTDFAMAGGTRAALSIADFNNDGKPDVAAADAVTKIFKNTHAVAGADVSPSSLTLEATTYNVGYNFVALDIDGDGKTDLNNGYGLNENNSSAGNISFLDGPTGVYTYAGGFNRAAPGDFNKDGKTDLALANGSAFVQIYQNESTTEPFVNNAYFSTFNTTPVNLVKPSNYGGIVSIDFDGDGYDDIATCSPFTDNFTFYHNLKVYGPITTSSFSVGTDIATGDEPNDITASDFDGDGKVDIAITFFNQAYVSVYRNTSTTGTISFAPKVDLPSANKGYSIASQDLDGDGLAEIVAIHRPNPGPGSFSVFQNKSTSGTISFNAVVNYPLTSPGRNPQAIAISDINLDQKPDILIIGDPYSTGGNAVMVFQNKITTGPVIDINPQPVSTAVCEGANASFTLAASGATNLAYQWQKFDGAVFNDLTNTGGYSGTTTSTLTINTTGMVGLSDYRCKVSGDLAIDKFSNTVTLTVNAVPSAPSTVGNSKCIPASITLTACCGATGEFRWYNVQTGGTNIAGQVNSSFNTPVISTTTSYYVSVNNGLCESTRTEVIAAIAPIDKPVITFDPPIFNASSTINLCEGYVQKFVAPQGFEVYSWSSGESSEEITITQPGTYSVIVEDADGCVSPASDILTVVINPLPLAEITINGTQLISSPGDSYQWHQNGIEISGATQSTFDLNVLEYGEYAVEVTDNGCTSMSDIFTYLITANETATSGWKVFPNPFNEALYIEAPTSENYQVDIIDLLGRSVRQFEGSNNRTLQLNQLQEGNYVMKISTSKHSLYFRIYKTH